MQNIVFFTGNASTVTFDWKVLAVEINLFSFLQFLFDPAFNSLLCFFLNISQLLAIFVNFGKKMVLFSFLNSQKGDKVKILLCWDERLVFGVVVGLSYTFEETFPMFNHLDFKLEKVEYSSIN